MQKIPLAVLTGFLGRGKTILMNDLLKKPELADSAVLIIESGEIALDHHLVEIATDNAVVLDKDLPCPSCFTILLRGYPGSSKKS